MFPSHINYVLGKQQNWKNGTKHFAHKIVEDKISYNGMLHIDHGVCLKNQSRCSIFDDLR